MSERTAGRIMGALFLAQVAVAATVYTRLLPPAHGREFLELAAPNAADMRLGILLATVLGVISIALAIVAWPVLRQRSERLALAYGALAVASFALLAMENLLLRQMLAMSLRYVAGEGREMLAAVGPTVRETWRQAHFTNLVFAHGAGFLLHLILFRFALVPRILAGAGMAASAWALVNVGMPLMGGTFTSSSLIPIALVQFAFITWLLARGLRAPAA